MLLSDAEAQCNLMAREKLQILFDRCFSSNNHHGLREHYRALRRMELNSDRHFTFEAVDISSLSENITIACDILCSDVGLNFIFCGNGTSSIYANGRLVEKLLLNLMSNAYLHGRGHLVTVKTTETAEHIKIEIKNEGTLATSKYGDGLKFVHNVCSVLKGNFFIKTDIFSTTAIMLMKKAPANACKSFDVPDFCEYLTDRLSPVYVELFGMEYR